LGFAAITGSSRHVPIHFDEKGKQRAKYPAKNMMTGWRKVKEYGTFS